MAKVIIVDDDEDLLKILLFAFEEKGYETKGITTGKEALNYLMQDSNISSACLLILDRMLPDMDGLDILKTFQEKHGKKIPILILSVLSSEKDTVTGFKQGATDYIAKPFSLPILMEKASSLISK